MNLPAAPVEEGDVKAAADAIGGMAQESSTNNRTEAGVIHNDAHFNVTSFSRSLDPLQGSFHYAQVDPITAAAVVTADMQTGRTLGRAILEASIFQLPAALNAEAMGFWLGELMGSFGFVT